MKQHAKNRYYNFVYTLLHWWFAHHSLYVISVNCYYLGVDEKIVKKYWLRIGTFLECIVFVVFILKNEILFIIHK